MKLLSYHIENYGKIHNQDGNAFVHPRHHPFRCAAAHVPPVVPQQHAGQHNSHHGAPQYHDVVLFGSDRTHIGRADAEPHDSNSAAADRTDAPEPGRTGRELT